MRDRMAWTCLFLLVTACGPGGGSGPGDSGSPDISTEREPCGIALDAWDDLWDLRFEDSGLDGRTPEINLMDAWGLAADDVYAVGFGGHILRHDGQAWRTMVSGTDADLEGVWGFVVHDDRGQEVRREIYAVGHNPGSGEAVILRNNGSAWQPMRVINDPDPSQPNPRPVRGLLHDVGGVAPPGPGPASHPTVVAVGSAGLIVALDPVLGEFREMRQEVEVQYTCGDAICTRLEYARWSPESLGGVFGESADSFVAVGNNGTILSYDGAGWRRVQLTGFTTHLKGIWGRNGELHAVGLDGTMMRRDPSGSWGDHRARLEGEGGQVAVPPVYLRSTWGFRQPGCGTLPGDGTDPADSDWTVFAGWNHELYLQHGGNICPFGNLGAIRMEGVWGFGPGSEAERTLPDGTVRCDPVDVVVTGVNGTIARLRLAGDP